MSETAPRKSGRVLLIVAATTFVAGVLLMFATYVALNGQPAPLFGSLLLIGVSFVTGVLGLLRMLTGAGSRADDAG